MKRHGAGVTSRASGPSEERAREEVADRLRRRYPRSRVPRPLLVAGTILLAAVALGWLVWAAWVQSHPAVAARVSAYHVESETRIAVTLTVDRPNPAVPVRCRVIAQAPDFSSVAEQSVLVPSSEHRVVDVRFTLTTLRRATSASAQGCTV